jgi:endonuclease YncB( thermonuclease family)
MIRALLAALLLTTPALAQTVSGAATVTDGDSLRVAGVAIRLWGIDAPELTQTCERGGQQYDCGREATEALRVLISGRPVACQERARDRYRRVVAVCTVAGRDIGAAMVEGGHAVAFVRYSRDYQAHEDRARAARRGLWSGEFVAPWLWRKGGR